MAAADRIRELEELILRYKRAYYSGSPEVPDDHYDRLEDELRRLHPSSPVLAMVGTDLIASGEWPTHRHRIPMGSQDKVMPTVADDGAVTLPELAAFDQAMASAR